MSTDAIPMSDVSPPDLPSVVEAGDVPAATPSPHRGTKAAPPATQVTLPDGVVLNVEKKKKKKRKVELAPALVAVDPAADTTDFQLARNGNGATHAEEPPVKRRRSRSKPVPTFTEWWQLARLALDAPRSKHARYHLKRMGDMLNAFPGMRTCRDTFKQYKFKTEVDEKALVSAQAHVLAFVLTGRWKWSARESMALKTWPVTAEEVTAMTAKFIARKAKSKACRDWVAPADDHPFALAKLEMKPDIRMDTVRELARLWISELPDQETILADVDDAPPNRPIEIPLGDLKVGDAVREVAKNYMQQVCKVLELPPMPSVALPVSLEHPEKTWEHAFHQFAVYLQALTELATN